jgi:hypothetical protein
MPSEYQTRAALSVRQSRPASLPGGWQAFLIAALAALLAGYWARQGDSAPRPEGRDGLSRVAEVAPEDVPAALDTLSAAPEQLAQFRKRAACSRRLAWVTVVRAPGQAPGRIRLQSGGYVSPAFDLLDTPVRVAIPYPAPYPTGHGVISVIGTTTEAIVALTPPWRVPAQAAVQAREVSWTPAGECPGAGK